MASCLQFIPIQGTAGYAVQISDAVNTCPGVVALNSAEYAIFGMFSGTGFDKEAFAFGSGAIFLMFSLGFIVGTLIKIVRKV